MYFTYAEQNRTFQALGVWVRGTANVTGLAEPEQVRTVLVSDGVLEALGVPPAAGRWLLAADQIRRSGSRLDDRHARATATGSGALAETSR